MEVVSVGAAGVVEEGAGEAVVEEGEVEEGVEVLSVGTGVVDSVFCFLALDEPACMGGG